MNLDLCGSDTTQFEIKSYISYRVYFNGKRWSTWYIVLFFFNYGKKIYIFVLLYNLYNSEKLRPPDWPYLSNDGRRTTKNVGEIPRFEFFILVTSCLFVSLPHHCTSFHIICTILLVICSIGDIEFSQPFLLVWQELWTVIIIYILTAGIGVLREIESLWSESSTSHFIFCFLLCRIVYFLFHFSCLFDFYNWFGDVRASALCLFLLLRVSERLGIIHTSCKV